MKKYFSIKKKIKVTLKTKIFFKIWKMVIMMIMMTMVLIVKILLIVYIATWMVM